MDYTRWAMTARRASDLTGATITDGMLTAAEDEVREFLGWSPAAPDTISLDASGVPLDRRVWAFGRALAWQAAWRLAHPGSVDDGDTSGVMVSESIGDYSYTRATDGNGQPVAPATFSPRARKLLVGSGWTAPGLAGTTAGSGGGRDPHGWQTNAY